MFDIEKIKKSASEDFEKAWAMGAKLLPKEGKVILKREGKPHVLNELIQRIRNILLSMGFDEIENRYILDEVEVYKQYGPEAPVILDRCYYLASLPRPEIGISKEKISIIQKIDPKFDNKKIEALASILREYKTGKIEGDNFVETLMERMRWKEEQATGIMESAFPELRHIKPISSNLILRSHMTAVWFQTLSALQNKLPHPIALFSIGPRFRREQSEDSAHLRVHYGASIVILDNNITLDEGKRISAEFLSRMDFKKIRFGLKKATSKYYAKQTEYEIFAEYKGKEVEVGDIGMYSPIALANYDIEYPVFNAGFGIERIGMVMFEYADIRKFSYPQFLERKITDEEIARMIKIDKKPLSEEGKRLQKALYETTLKYKDAKTPFSVLAFKGNLGREISIEVFKDEADKKLLGPAGVNKIFVYNGNIISFNPTTQKELKEVEEKGIDTGIDILQAITNYAAYRVEKEVKEKKKIEFIIPIAKGPSDVNISIPDYIYHYITANKKRIDFRGPIFFGVRERRE